MNNEDLELLKFYHEVGVDCTLTEGEEEKKVENERAAQSSVIEQKKAMFPSDWIIEARKLASECGSVDELRSAVKSFEGCEIKKLQLILFFPMVIQMQKSCLLVKHQEQMKT